MALLEKCLLADLLMIAVHFLSQSSNTYLTGLVLGFPDLSILAYSFLYRARGSRAVRGATEFALAATAAFAAFLVTPNTCLKRFPFVKSVLPTFGIQLFLPLFYLPVARFGQVIRTLWEGFLCPHNPASFARLPSGTHRRCWRSTRRM